jgi:hypothetical protein
MQARFATILGLGRTSWDCWMVWSIVSTACDDSFRPFWAAFEAVAGNVPAPTGGNEGFGAVFWGQGCSPRLAGDGTGLAGELGSLALSCLRCKGRGFGRALLAGPDAGDYGCVSAVHLEPMSNRRAGMHSGRSAFFEFGGGGRSTKWSSTSSKGWNRSRY